MGSLFCLPLDAVLNLMRHIVAASDVAHIIKLAAVSTQCLQLVATSDWFWQEQCQALGWIRSGMQHPPPTLPPTWQAQAASSSSAAGPSELWFEYYSLRMSCRWRLRALVRKYIPFLNIHSRLAIQPGASIAELEATESRMGMRLPWELWELYRFRAGQAPGPGVSFADTCRLLGLQELHLAAVEPPNCPSLAPEGPCTQQQQLAGVQAQLPLLSVMEPAAAAAGLAVAAAAPTPARHLDRPVNSSGCDHHASGAMCSSTQPCRAQAGQAAAAAAAASAQTEVAGNGAITSSGHSGNSGNSGSGSRHPSDNHTCNIAGDGTVPGSTPGSSAAAAPPAAGAQTGAAVVFMSNTTGWPLYAVSPDSSVHLMRGFTCRRVAGSVSGLIQRLLT